MLTHIIDNIMKDKSLFKFFLFCLLVLTSLLLLVIGRVLRSSDFEIAIAGVKIRRKNDNIIIDMQMEYAKEKSVELVSNCMCIFKNILYIKEEEEAYRHCRLLTIFIADRILENLKDFFNQKSFLEMGEKEFLSYVNLKIQYMFEECMSISEIWYLESVMNMPRSQFIEKCREPLKNNFFDLMTTIFFEAREIANIVKNRGKNKK